MEPEKLKYGLRDSSVQRTLPRISTLITFSSDATTKAVPGRARQRWVTLRHLWRIFSASSLVMSRPRSDRDCLISEESMWPVHTRTNAVNVPFRDSLEPRHTAPTDKQHLAAQRRSLPSLFLSKLLKVSFSFFSCSLRYLENSLKSSPSFLSWSPDEMIFCRCKQTVQHHQLQCWRWELLEMTFFQRIIKCLNEDFDENIYVYISLQQEPLNRPPFFLWLTAS